MKLRKNDSYLRQRVKKLIECAYLNCVEGRDCGFQFDDEEGVNFSMDIADDNKSLSVTEVLKQVHYSDVYGIERYLDGNLS